MKLTVAALTPTGVRVVQGAFALVDAHGVPLELVVDRLSGAGMMLDWLDFYRAAVAAGQKPANVVARLREAVGDVYGPAFAEGWELAFAKAREADARYPKGTEAP